MKYGDYFPHTAGQGKGCRQVLEDKEDNGTDCSKLCYLLICIDFLCHLEVHLCKLLLGYILLSLMCL